MPEILQSAGDCARQITEPRSVPEASSAGKLASSFMRSPIVQLVCSERFPKFIEREYREDDKVLFN
jgi:hypothetical protein